MVDSEFDEYDEYLLGYDDEWDDDEQDDDDEAVWDHNHDTDEFDEGDDWDAALEDPDDPFNG